MRQATATLNFDTARQGLHEITADVTRWTAAQGFAHTTVRSIAERAGVSAALILHHYGSKDALALCGLTTHMLVTLLLEHKLSNM